MAMTYDSLVAEIPVSIMGTNTALLANMGLVIRRAEDEIIERIDHDAFKTVLPPVIVDPDTPTFDLFTVNPVVLEVGSVRASFSGLDVPLERREANRMIATFPGGDTGTPRFYAEEDYPLRFRVFPTPDTTYELTVRVNQAPTRLAPELQESVLTRLYPRLLENGVLKYAAQFQRNTADEQRYGAAFDAALGEINARLARRRRDDTGVPASDTANS